MADEKKILVVDDHFEMLEFLRSMLELSNQDYEVLAVPSAEEGLLELRRTQFNLVITDVRLPGMSGFDLVRRTRAIKSDTPVIMITAYSTAQGRKEAEELGVFRYFPKPLDTDEMLSAVHKALYGESVILAKPTAVPTPSVPSTPTPTISNQIQKRLETLRTDTGASQLVLAMTSGQIMWSEGKGHIPNAENLITILAHNLEDSFRLAHELGRREPFTLQYHVGAAIELYMANVGREYFLAMFFDIKARRGRIGTVWVFAQRAIKELMTLLPQSEQTVEDKPATAPLVHAPPVDLDIETAVSKPVPLTPNEPEPELELDDSEWIDVDPEELADLLSGEGELLKDTEALEAFWDDALIESDSDNIRGGFSWEEAKRQGLISTDSDEA